MKYVMMVGNPTDGFVVVGPFDYSDDAARYLETEHWQDNCWIVELHQPATLKGQDE